MITIPVMAIAMNPRASCSARITMVAETIRSLKTSMYICGSRFNKSHSLRIVAAVNERGNRIALACVEMAAEFSIGVSLASLPTTGMDSASRVKPSTKSAIEAAGDDERPNPIQRSGRNGALCSMRRANSPIECISV